MPHTKTKSDNEGRARSAMAQRAEEVQAAGKKEQHGRGHRKTEH